MTGYMWFHSAHLSATLRPLSALRGKNDTKQYPFVRAYLSGSADMSATIRRDHIVDPVVGNRRPFAVHLDFVMVANHAALRRATVHEVYSRCLCRRFCSASNKTPYATDRGRPRNILLAPPRVHRGTRTSRRLWLPFPEHQGP